MLLEARKKAPLLDNEAIALGAIEAGNDVVTGYPGTPSSEVLEALFNFAKEGMGHPRYVEWPINAKVALEIGRQNPSPPWRVTQPES